MRNEKAAATRQVDVLLVGGGIMSATLGTLLQELEPNWSIEMVERLDRVAEESSNGWNNAGTGHSALCELNYTPVDASGEVNTTKALRINEQFQVSRQFWAHQLSRGVLQDARSFINPAPHMSFVRGAENVEFLRKRHKALSRHTLFAGMILSTDRDEIAQWAPLMMEGLHADEPVAATWAPQGTDVDFGQLTQQFTASMMRSDTFRLSCGTEVDRIDRLPNGSWRLRLTDRAKHTHETVEAKFVFLGAGGGALPLLQHSGIPEARDYAGFPVGGSFLVCDNPEVVARHGVKVYGKAAVGSPPMSVPHLDRRTIGGQDLLLFGPFATFSTRFLKKGSLLDLPSTVRPSNVLPMMDVGLHNFDLIRYLAGQLMLNDKARIKALQEYLPTARPEDWKLWQAGQRVQVIKRARHAHGALQLGTEIVAAQDGSIAALLGASPGASTAAPIMLDLLERVFPDRVASDDWQDKLRQIVPSYGLDLSRDDQAAARIWAETSRVLDLPEPPAAVANFARQPIPSLAAG